METLPLNEGLDALPEGPPALAERPGLVKAGERRAAYSDLDYNGHVNNVRYVQWIQDSLEPEILTKAGRVRMDINYLSEVKYGELTEIWTRPLEPPAAAEEPGFDRAFAVEGRCQGGGPAFRAELYTRVSPEARP
jgi:hypothetical protein